MGLLEAIVDSHGHILVVPELGACFHLPYLQQ